MVAGCETAGSAEVGLMVQTPEMTQPEVASGMRKLMVSADGLAFACWMAARSEQKPVASRQRPSSVVRSLVSAVVLTT
jgi:hypothetical protein